MMSYHGNAMVMAAMLEGKVYGELPSNMAAATMCMQNLYS